MALLHETAPWRAKMVFAKMRQVVPAMRRLATAAIQPKPRDLARLDDRLLRDIGLDAADVEVLRHRWPSQTTHHPRG